MTGSGEAGLREQVRGLLRAVEPPAAPVDVIIRRGRARRLRRAGVVAGGLGLAGIIAAATLLTPARAPGPGQPLPVTVPAAGIAGPAGVFARGIADGRAWRLALQDVADPGSACLPAITVNQADADLVQPNSSNYAAVAPGPVAPGLGFAFVQLPAGVTGIDLDGQETIPATTATVCGLHYRLAGFAYRLTHPPQVTAANSQASYQLPPVGGAGTSAASATPAAAVEAPYGVWTNVGTPGAETAQGVVASGRNWTMTVLLDAGGDCYELDWVATTSWLPLTDVCGPVGTPDGPETIVALPLSGAPAGRPGPTGYAVAVSPATNRLRAAFSDGSTQLVTPRVVGGRRYAAFVAGPSLRLKRLTWLDATGKAFASTTALPRSGYTQFQP